MRTIEIQLYKFDELSEEAQQKVIQDNYDINTDYQWWDNTYLDASEVGITITGFDTDQYCNGDIVDTEQTAHDIIKKHGEQCETYKTAADYLSRRDALIMEWPCDDEGQYINVDELDAKLDDMGEDFTKSILEDYRIMLRNEYEYLQSKEAIIETIEANEYDFTEDGNRY